MKSPLGGRGRNMSATTKHKNETNLLGKETWVKQARMDAPIHLDQNNNHENEC